MKLYLYRSKSGHDVREGSYTLETLVKKSKVPTAIEEKITFVDSDNKEKKVSVLYVETDDPVLIHLAGLPQKWELYTADDWYTDTEYRRWLQVYD